MNVFHRTLLAALVALPLAACASGGASASSAAAPDARPAEAWGIKTREHVDLWLHGFSLVTDDTARVPWFRHGYADGVTVEKNRRGVTTKLDGWRDSLRRRLEANRDLAGAQFAALYFGTWEEMKEGYQWFERTEGNPRRASSEYQARIIAFYANLFPTPADRQFARRMFEGLDDEREQWWRGWWLAQQRERAGRLAAVDSQWRATWRPALLPVLQHANLRAGDVLLSVPLGPEGRTVNAGGRNNVVAVPLPAADEPAELAAWVFAHEAVNGFVAVAVNDHTTPAEKRAGVAERHISGGVVRAGYLVLRNVLPALADGYARYYVAALRNDGVDARERERTRLQGVSGDALRAELERAYPLPDGIAQAIGTQVDLILGGI